MNNFYNWIRLKENSEELKHYMFFSNLKAIKEKVDRLIQMDPHELDRMIDNGHDWASDHISSSRDDIEEVYNWISGELE